MPSGPKIPDDLRSWITHKAQQHPAWKPAAIHTEMVDWLEATHPNYSVPGHDSVRKIANNARKLKSQLDDPWSLGACESFNIPHDAVPDLLEIWKRCIIGATTFTIRQAIWVARLRWVVPVTPDKSRLAELRHWAVAYAAEQRAAEALGKPLDTGSLDSNFVFCAKDGSFEWTNWWLASNLGALPRSGGGADLDALVEKNVCFDALVRSVHLPFLLNCLSRHPNLRVVIDHGAKPDIAEGEWQPWADSISAIANQTSAYCKISGLITEADGSQTYDDVMPYLDHLLEAFGPGRLIWGSDWPVLNLAGDYEGWHGASIERLSRLAVQDQENILGHNAIRFYGLPTDADP